MDVIYILTGLGTVVAAIAGLALTCYLERRSLAARRHQAQRRSASTRGEEYRTATPHVG